MPPPSNARMLAPIALVAFLVAVIVVAAGSLGGDDSPTAPAPLPESPSADTSTTPASTGESGPPATTTTDPEPGGTVIVQAGDTPSLIAEREGIALERLLELNPDIDPSGLRVGQELKLAP